ncbi:hypothetical protein HZH68_000671 [Vespula germanica]|uniref:Uncharacterized protein n=1 Tax=Vespula germanica TaxID=30212 RepID=A0A834NU75_VESGE|nr:hypothetical protein HZH68_000671 [Vespula germanica]
MVGNGWGEWKGRGRSNRRDFLRRDQDQSGYARFYAFHHVQQPHSKHVEEEEEEGEMEKEEEEEEEEEDVLRSNTDSNVYSDSSRVNSDRKKAVRINVDVCGEWWEECEWPKTHASRVQSIGKSPFIKKQKSSGAPKEEETKEEKMKEDEKKEEEEEEEEEEQEKKKKRRRPGEF